MLLFVVAVVLQVLSVHAEIGTMQKFFPNIFAHVLL